MIREWKTDDRGNSYQNADLQCALGRPHLSFFLSSFHVLGFAHSDGAELGIGPACMCTSSKDGVKSAEEAALPNSDFEREDRCLPGLCAEEELYHRPETPVCPSDVKAWGSPIRWENMTTIDEFEEFTLDSGILHAWHSLL